MKVIVTESQLRNIVKRQKQKRKKEVDETDETPSLAPVSPSTANYNKSEFFASAPKTVKYSSTAAPSADEYPAYPETVKWESGVTRGPANQIAITKWEDTVGSSLIRGKSNPLK